jgi:tetratricopeptide (TPR) repeat protein
VAVPYFFGLGSKETVITLPATILLYDFLFLSNAQFRNLLSRWRFYLVFVLGAVGAVYYILTVALRQTVGGNLPGNLSAWNYLLTQFRVIAHYVRLIFLPIGLNLDYDFRRSTSPLEVSVIASFLFLCVLVFLGWRLRRSAPIFSFSIFWFFVTLSPTSSIVPIADVIFEHRLYLPLVGVSLSFPSIMEWAYSKLRKRFSIPGNPLGYASVALVVLGLGTVYRNYVWSDEVRLFTDIVSKSQNKARPLNGLAWAYYKRADYGRAIDVLEQGFPKLSIEGKKELTDTLANMYLKVGRYDSAIDLFNKSTKYFTGPQLAQEYNNIGVTYLYMWNDLQTRRTQMPSEEYANRLEQILKPAAEAFLKGLEIEPDMPWALDSYVNATFYRGKGDELSAAASDRLKQKETFDDLYTVGKLAFNAGDFAKADQYFERAGKLRNDVKILFFNHGYALTQLHQDDRAIIKYIESIRIDPIFIEAHHNLGLIYMRQSNYPKAREAFDEVLRLDPKHLSSNLNLATIYMSQGNKVAARSHLLTVLEADPGNEQAATLLAQLGS